MKEILDKINWKWSWKIVICGIVAIVAQLAGINEHSADMITHGAEMFGMGGVAGALLDTLLG